MAARDDIEALLDQYEPEVKAEFLGAIRDVVDATVLNRIVERLEAGDLEGAVAAIDAPSQVFNTLANLAIATMFTAAGTAAMSGLPRLRTPEGVVFFPRFDVRSPRARNYLDQEQERLVNDLSREVHTVARETFSEGLAQQRSPRALALDVLGRVPRLRVQREGGLVGLTPQLARYVRAARQELSSSDSGEIRSYLRRRLRDVRLDRPVERVLETGEPLSPERVDAIVGRYAKNLLNFRASTLAHTETNDNAHAGQAEAMRQVVESGAAPPETVRKTWRTVGDARVRDSHMFLEGVSLPVGEPFRTRGGLLMHPGDRSLGADASEIMNCRCHVVYGLGYIAMRGAGSRKIG